MANHKEIPPRLELECLKALWTLGQGSVRDVKDRLTPTRPLAYTTIMTVLDRLVRRGGVERAKSGRSFVYRPLLTRESLQTIALQELIDTFFDGSEEALVAYLECRTRNLIPRKPVDKEEPLEVKAGAALV
jgi:predicted transcriptional regulator